MYAKNTINNHTSIFSLMLDIKLKSIVHRLFISHNHFMPDNKERGGVEDWGVGSGNDTDKKGQNKSFDGGSSKQ